MCQQQQQQQCVKKRKKEDKIAAVGYTACTRGALHWRDLAHDLSKAITYIGSVN
jgi:hypothetical protein